MAHVAIKNVRKVTGNFFPLKFRYTQGVNNHLNVYKSTNKPFFIEIFPFPIH